MVSGTTRHQQPGCKISSSQQILFVEDLNRHRCRFEEGLRFLGEGSGVEQVRRMFTHSRAATTEALTTAAWAAVAAAGPPPANRWRLGAG